MSAAKNVIAFPQRRTYAGLEQQPGLPYRQLPFFRMAGKKEKYWVAPRVRDPDVAFDVGREYAAHFVQFLKDNPKWNHGGLLEEIARRMDLGNFFDPTYDIRVGFFAHLEFMLCEYAKRAEVFSDVDREAARDHAVMERIRHEVPDQQRATAR